MTLQVPIAPIDATYRFSAAQYDEMGRAGTFAPDDRVELIEGEIVVMSPTGPRHAARVNRAVRIFLQKLGDRAQVGAQDPIVLGARSEPQADLTILRPKPDFYESGHPTAADILFVVEVSDTTLAFDRQVNIPLYARQGVAEVWLENLGQSAITVYRDPSPEGYRTSFDARRGQHLTPLAFPDLAIAAEDLLG